MFFMFFSLRFLLKINIRINQKIKKLTDYENHPYQTKIQNFKLTDFSDFFYFSDFFSFVLLILISLLISTFYSSFKPKSSIELSSKLAILSADD